MILDKLPTANSQAAQKLIEVQNSCCCWAGRTTFPDLIVQVVRGRFTVTAGQSGYTVGFTKP